MAEFIKRQPAQARDYTERFEFKLTVGDNIICQRFFKINNFNEASLRSCELVDVINNCVRTIDNDLKSKTISYLEVFSPSYFNSVEEMNKYYESEVNRNRMRPGFGIVVKDSPFDYAWDGEKPKELSFKFDNGELNSPISDNDIMTYKFAFIVDGREVCSRIWEGMYPAYIRNSIDLTNKRGKQDKSDLSHLNFEQYLDYCIVEGRNDLVWGLIKDICTACSYHSANDYTISEAYGNKTYNNRQTDKELFKLYGLSFDGMTKNKRK
ncbi:MAG: hypothetical protein J6M08_05190 [Methanobrevibacter sp.]|nr:hypothetical protein [Methanobrevibacter sp.]